MPPVRPKSHQGPVNGGPEAPGEPGTSPSTVRPDYAGVNDQRADPAVAALASLKRLVRGVY